MIDPNTIVRETIKALVPYSSARDEFTGDAAVFLDANENPFGSYNRYPDPYQKVLKKAIAGLKKVSEDCIFLGNGSDEVIDLLFRIFCDPGRDKALTFSPTYGMYKVSAGINDVELLSVPLNEAFQIDMEKTIPFLADKQIKLIFICSPNNPTGNSIRKQDIEFILKNANGIVVIDEAYIDFSPFGSWSEAVEHYPNLVVMQTLSKAWGLAGIRLGMAFANPEIVWYFNKVKPPYNISAPNQQAAIRAIQYKTDFDRNLNTILEEKTRMEKRLSELHLIEKIWPSDANFLLVQVPDADTIYAALTGQHLIVRNRNKVVPNSLRITIGTPEENELLLQALRKIAGESD